MSLKIIPQGPIDNNTHGIGLNNGLPPNWRQAIISADGELIHWRIYAALGADELTYLSYHVVVSLDYYITRYCACGALLIEPWIIIVPHAMSILCPKGVVRNY